MDNPHANARGEVREFRMFLKYYFTFFIKRKDTIAFEKHVYILNDYFSQRYVKFKILEVTNLLESFQLRRRDRDGQAKLSKFNKQDNIVSVEK